MWQSNHQSLISPTYRGNVIETKPGFNFFSLNFHIAPATSPNGNFFAQLRQTEMQSQEREAEGW